METTNAAGNHADANPQEALMALSPETLSRLFDSTVSVKETDGRWYIQAGHAGFNSPANNGLGYSSRERALAAIRRYDGGRGFSASHSPLGRCFYPGSSAELGICGSDLAVNGVRL